MHGVPEHAAGPSRETRGVREGKRDDDVRTDRWSHWTDGLGRMEKENHNIKRTEPPHREASWSGLRERKTHFGAAFRGLQAKTDALAGLA